MNLAWSLVSNSQPSDHFSSMVSREARPPGGAEHSLYLWGATSYRGPGSNVAATAQTTLWYYRQLKNAQINTILKGTAVPAKHRMREDQLGMATQCLLLTKKYIWWIKIYISLPVRELLWRTQVAYKQDALWKINEVVRYCRYSRTSTENSAWPLMSQHWQPY